MFEDLEALEQGKATTPGEAYAKTESPAGTRRNEQRADQKADKAREKLNKELQKQGREADRKQQQDDAKLMREAKPSAPPAPIPLGGGTDSFSNPVSPKYPDFVPFTLQQRSDPDPSQAARAGVTTRMSGLQYDADTDTFTAVLFSASITDVTTYTE